MTKEEIAKIRKDPKVIKAAERLLNAAMNYTFALEDVTKKKLESEDEPKQNDER